MKKKKILLIALVISLMICTSGMSMLYSSALTKGKGKMAGSVVDAETGEPIAGATIKLFFPDQSAFHKPFPKTNADGKWRALYVRKGRWDIDFVKDGYEVKKLSFFVDPTPGTSNPPIDVQLMKLEGPAVAQNIMAEVDKAVALMGSQQHEKALQELLAIKEKYKEEMGVEIVNLHIGNIYSHKGEYKKAIEFFMKSLEKFPSNQQIVLSIGNAYSNLNDFEKAKDWFNKLNIDEIKNADTLYNMAVLAYNGGDFERAVTYFKKATEIRTDFAEAFYQMGMTYTALNKPQEAVVALKRFMELAPDSPNYETAKAIVEAFGK